MLSYSISFPSGPVPSEEFIAIQWSTSVLRFHDRNSIIVLQLHNGFQLLLFVAHATDIAVDALELGYCSCHLFFFFWQEILIPVWPFSGTSMVSNASITHISLLPSQSLSPASTEMADQRIVLTHGPSNIDIPGSQAPL